MIISIVVAVSEFNVIGKNNQLLWHLPSDLKYFKNLTMGHHMVMGRKTFESIGKALPGRVSIIVTRDKNYTAEGCIVVDSLEKAIAAAKNETELFIIGGGEIYSKAIEIADKIYLTKIYSAFEGDTFFPAIDYNVWEATSTVDHLPDEKNKFPYSYITLERIKK
jgi:dihydrofolate reductase